MQPSFFLPHTSVPGEFAFISNQTRNLTYINVSQGKGREEQQIDVSIEAEIDIAAATGVDAPITSVSMCNRSDIRAVVCAHDDGRLSFPMEEPLVSHISHIDYGRVCSAVAWNPIYHHHIAASLANETVMLFDVAQVTTQMQVTTNTQFLQDTEACICLNSQPIVGGISAMEWLPCMPQSLVLGTASKASPLLLDPRTGASMYLGADGNTATDSLGGGISGASTSSKRRDGGGVNLLACHPNMPYVASVSHEPRKAVVQLWDVRNSGRSLHRRSCEREAFNSMQWYPCGSDLILAASLRGENAIRIMKFSPNTSDSLQMDDGYYSSFMSAATSEGARSHSQADAFRSMRAIDRTKLKNRCEFQDFSWLNIVSGKRSAQEEELEASAASLRKTSAAHHDAEDNDGTPIRPGVGVPDAVIGITAAGEVNVISLQSGPVLSWVSPSSVLTAFEGTLMLVNAKHESEIEQYRNDVAFRMKKRLSDGFGINPTKNQAVARKCRDQPLVDLFRYVATMKELVFTPNHSFPGVIQLLTESDDLNGVLMNPALSTTGLEVANGTGSTNNAHGSFSNRGGNGAKFQQQKAPTFYETLPRNRQLILQAMGWVGEEMKSPIAADDVESFERRTSIHIFLGSFDKAVEMLLSRADRHPSYAPLAAVLEGVRPSEPAPWSQTSTEAICRSLSDWLSIAVNFVAEFWPHCSLDDSASILMDSRMPIADRIALTAARVHNKATRIAHCERFQKKLIDDLTPSLFVLTGLNEGSAHIMQHYVDCTADVQLAACLFAWVCVPKQIVSTGWTEWNKAYRDFLNDMGLFIQRAEYDVSRREILDHCDAQDPKGSVVGVHGVGLAAARKPASKLPVEVRCQCGQQLQDTAPIKSTTAFSKQQNRLQCPNPSCKYPNGFPLCAVCGKKMEPRGQDVPIQRWFVWCTRCLHGGHMQHVGEWFKKHKKCPIEDCNCFCQVAEAGGSDQQRGADDLHF